MKVIPIIFEGKGKYGDFDWMIQQPKYKKCLFIFNDNEEMYYTNEPGGGNAIIRKYNNCCGIKYPKQIYGRSAGIPTGTLKRGGYQYLTKRVKKIIDNAFMNVDEWIDCGWARRVFYSCEKDGYTFGTSIFNVGDKVIDYINMKIDLIKEYKY